MNNTNQPIVISDEWVHGLLVDGALMREVKSVLNYYLSEQFDIAIVDVSSHRGEVQFAVFRYTKPPTQLFQSASYSACLEYALKHPAKDAK